ncbi:MAG: nucleotidyltransferase domain-containing protein [Promethearchaeota archaeon]
MEPKNTKISRKLYKRHKEKLKELNNFISEINSVLDKKLICVILIGSRARYDFNIGSDFDIIMIGDWSHNIFFERVNEINKEVRLPLLPIDYFLYRPEEIKRFIEQGNPMILDGFIEGICLYNKKYFQEICDLIKNQMKIGNISKEQNIWKINKSFFL